MAWSLQDALVRDGVGSLVEVRSHNATTIKVRVGRWAMVRVSVGSWEGWDRAER
jgi:hypothetical protein